MYYLYCKEKDMPIFHPEETPFLRGCELKVFRPRLFRLSAPYETISFKVKLSRLQFYFSSKGNYTIYHLCDGNHIVHTAYVVPPCGKFSFMKQGDYEIGPCMTENTYRRRGAYRYILSRILENEDVRPGTVYMIVSDTNSTSIKGIESVGFVRIGVVRQVGLFKNYRLET